MEMSKRGTITLKEELLSPSGWKSWIWTGIAKSIFSWKTPTTATNKEYFIVSLVKEKAEQLLRNNKGEICSLDSITAKEAQPASAKDVEVLLEYLKARGLIQMQRIKENTLLKFSEGAVSSVDIGIFKLKQTLALLGSQQKKLEQDIEAYVFVCLLIPQQQHSNFFGFFPYLLKGVLDKQRPS
jgi:hypothetical protein